MSRKIMVIGSMIVTGLIVGILISQEELVPGLFSLNTFSVAIENVQYRTRVEASEVVMRESSPDKYRYAIVTLRIRKPEGKEVVLHAADLTLHYLRRNGDYDVAPCEAISNFSQYVDEERPLNAPPFMGPGWVRVKTGSITTRASTIYVDAVFAKVEPDVSRLWICIAQPASYSGYLTSGWEP